MRRLLRVNLSSGLIKEEEIPSEIAEAFVGGRGFGAPYMYDEIPPGIDPLGRENKLLLGTGPLAGTSAQSLSKWMVVTKVHLRAPLLAAMVAAISDHGSSGPDLSS